MGCPSICSVQKPSVALTLGTRSQLSINAFLRFALNLRGYSSVNDPPYTEAYRYIHP